MGRGGGLRRLPGGDENLHRSPHAPLTPCLPPSSGNIYWTDPGFDVFEVARLNGSFRYVVISQGLDSPGRSQSTRRRGEEQGGAGPLLVLVWSRPSGHRPVLLHALRD